MRKIVYIEATEGVIEPSEVKTGNAYGNRIMITSGLREGDRIVTSGNFLVDSESRMRSTPVVSPATPQEVKPNTKQDAAVTSDPVCGMPLDSCVAKSPAGQGEARRD
jgi:membrane fusion protein, copper/silver efflux system